MQTARLDHIALLVSSVERSARYWQERNFEVATVDTFEETREIYIGGSLSARILLMEPVGKCSYHNALARRGQGLHHLGLNVFSIDDYLASLAGSGWYLHPNSIRSLKNLKRLG